MNERRHPPTGEGELPYISLPWRRNGQRLTGTRSLSPYGGGNAPLLYPSYGVLRSKTPFSTPLAVLRPLRGSVRRRISARSLRSKLHSQTAQRFETPPWQMVMAHFFVRGYNGRILFYTNRRYL
jgi:hypothetical protein